MISMGATSCLNFSGLTDVADEKECEKDEVDTFSCNSPFALPNQNRFAALAETEDADSFISECPCDRRKP